MNETVALMARYWKKGERERVFHDLEHMPPLAAAAYAANMLFFLGASDFKVFANELSRLWEAHKFEVCAS